MPALSHRNNYRLGSLLSLTTALLLACQEPFSSLAARHLDFAQFVFLTQSALLLSVPVLMIRRSSRRDFVAILRNRAGYWQLLVIFLIGMTGLFLYNLSLGRAHPIIIAAILNLSPFWASLVALVISGKRIAVPLTIFYGCLAGAFCGAMAVVWSQMGDERPSVGDLIDNIRHGGWIYAIPIPLLSALGGTLIGKWYAQYDESAAIAANFVASSFTLIPITGAILIINATPYSGEALAIVLMLVGTMIAASAGRVLYQISLTVTDNDNGFVTMFFLLVPALTGLISFPLSWWIPDLKFVVGPLFFLGLLMIAGSLATFSLKAWK